MFETSSFYDKRLLLLKEVALFHPIWNGVTSLYSSCKSTNISDKCVAFAGIVKDFQASTQSGYLAGLWRHNIEQQLLWRTIHPASRPQCYLAPSWSWLSIDGEHVAGSVYKKDRMLVNILDVSLTNSNDNILEAQAPKFKG